MILPEAVAEVAASPNRYRFSPEALGVVLAAARAYLDGETVWWCEEHEYSGYEEACLYPWWYALENKLARTHSALDEARSTCRMVEAVLSVKATEEDE